MLTRSNYNFSARVDLRYCFTARIRQSAMLLISAGIDRNYNHYFTEISPRILPSSRFASVFASIQGNVMNYLVLGNFIILTSVFLIHKQELWIGMVLVAAMPPSLEIITYG